MLILGVDTETTGLDPEQDRVIELGWCLWDTDTKKPLVMRNELFHHVGLEVSDKITEINGITTEMLVRYGESPVGVLSQFHRAGSANNIVAIVAHNAPFDKAMIDAELARLQYSPLNIPWIDTATDVPYPKSIQTRKLTHLCAEHGFLNPFPHRALTDVLSMLQMTAGYDWDQILEVSKSPMLVLEAKCRKPWQDEAEEGFKDIDRAKALGFRFDFKAKKWLKNLRTCHSDSFREQLQEANLKAIILKE